ncbi:MAG TPA: Ca2+-dependent phosphoinositide-specific phospholipase C [Nannocystaceae bacterium]|nr:Ca2+-dependent phosphoinositide-specific phospholipase C [Nannocystaceae bacterium]
MLASPRASVLVASLLIAACGGGGGETAGETATMTTNGSTGEGSGGVDATTTTGGESTGGTSAGTSSTGEPGSDAILRVTDVTMRCTHNSYHVEPVMPIDDSHRYTHAPLDVQLEEQGVRAFELDVHSGAGFPVFHIPLGLDDASNCPDLGACLGLIDGWSAAHPAHHLIVVWIEMKDELDSGALIKDYDAFDAVIRGALAADRLYEPDEFKRGRPTLRAALEEEGWPTLGETRGKVMIVLLDDDAPHSAGYTRDFTSLDGRAMFARANTDHYQDPWAVIAKVNDPADAAGIAAARAAGLLVASNTGAADLSDDENAAKLAAGIANGSHMLCDDFPAPVDGREYWMDLPGGTPSICNQQGAPPECSPAAVESLGG